MDQFCKSEEELRRLVTSLTAHAKYVVNIRIEDDGWTVSWQDHKTYIAQDGQVFPDEVWTTAEGKTILVQDLEPAHCQNVLRMILRQDRERQIALDDLVEKAAGAGFDISDADEFKKMLDQVKNDDPVERVLH